MANGSTGKGLCKEFFTWYIHTLRVLIESITHICQSSRLHHNRLVQSSYTPLPLRRYGYLKTKRSKPRPTKCEYYTFSIFCLSLRFHPHVSMTLPRRSQMPSHHLLKNPLPARLNHIPMTRNDPIKIPPGNLTHTAIESFTVR